VPVKELSYLPTPPVQQLLLALFGDEVTRRLTEVPESRMKIPLGDQVDALRSITQDACDCILRRRLPRFGGIPDYTQCEEGVERLRRRLQDARRNGNSGDAALLVVTLRTISAKYKKEIVAVKEKV